MYLLHISLLIVLLPHAISEVRYDGHRVYRIYPRSTDDIQLLREYIEQKPELDVWREPTHPADPVDIQVPPHHDFHFRQHFRRHNIAHEPFIHNLQRHIERTRRSEDGSVGWFDKYWNYEQIMLWLENIAKECSDICSLLTIGQSTEGRALKVLKIGNPSTHNKEKVWIDAGIHAREWISPANAMFIIERLTTGYNSNAQVKALVDTYDWYVLPIINPDGYAYTWTNDRLWRKTRSVNESTGCIGVDANRNFDYKWMTIGASSNSCSNIYAGPHPYSEPETKAMADFIKAVQGSWKLYFTLHSYKQLWMLPWGYSKEKIDDHDKMMKAAKKGVEALTAVHGTPYRYGAASSILYQSSGTSRDWAYGVPKIEYVYTIELRDTGKHGFVLPPEQIKPCVQETWAGLRDMMLFIKETDSSEDSREDAHDYNENNNNNDSSDNDDIGDT